jgi:predicted peroxiredoxin
MFKDPRALGCLLLFFLSPAFVAVSLAPPAAAQETKVVVHLTHYSDDLHAAFMAIKLAGAFQKNGADVTIFTDLEGVRLADMRAPQNVRWGHSSELAPLYVAFIEAGGKVLVCPHCAMAAGLETKDLRKGAKIGTEDEVVQLLLAAEKILDY